MLVIQIVVYRLTVSSLFLSLTHALDHFLVFGAARFDHHSPEVIKEDVEKNDQADSYPCDSKIRSQPAIQQRADHINEGVKVEAYERIQPNC